VSFLSRCSPRYDMVRAGKLHVVHVDRRAHSSTCGERYVKRFECVGLHAPLLEPGLDCVEVGLEYPASFFIYLLFLPKLERV
jgi:hypothetical protein